MKQKHLYATKFSNLPVPKLAAEMCAHRNEARKLAESLATPKGRRTKGLISSIELEENACRD